MLLSETWNVLNLFLPLVATWAGLLLLSVQDTQAVCSEGTAIVQAGSGPCIKGILFLNFPAFEIITETSVPVCQYCANNFQSITNLYFSLRDILLIYDFSVLCQNQFSERCLLGLDCLHYALVIWHKQTFRTEQLSCHHCRLMLCT